MRTFFSKLFSLLSYSDKKVLLFLILFSILISLIETLGIAVIMPFITVASDFSNIHSNAFYQTIYAFFSFSSDIEFVSIFGISLIFFYLFRSILNFSYFYSLSRFSRGRYHLIAYRLFENYLGRSYRHFTTLNSGELSKTIITETQNLTTILHYLLFMISEFFVILLIYATLLYINWKITLLLSIFLALNVLLLTKTISKWIKQQGSKREIAQKKFYEIINSTLANFKMIKLKSQDKNIRQQFANASYSYAKANIVRDSLDHVPRLLLEAVGFSIVAFIVVYLVIKYKTDISATLPLLSVFILGLYRLMPSANRILNSYNQILFCHKALDIVHNDLIYEIESIGYTPISYQQNIQLKSIVFHYESHKPLLKNITLTINFGDKIGIVGESGSGKSTLVDLITGLYRPKNGSILIDNVALSSENIGAWRKKIGYVPQSIYLFDGSVAANVAFGDPIEESRIIDVLKQAKIYHFFCDNHEGIETQVGEGGILLSGGQKQRIAIARALYSNPEILVLDEATSALDNDTEAQIMEEIYDISKDKTLIIIAHRLSTIDKCQKVYELRNGSIFEIR